MAMTPWCYGKGGRLPFGRGTSLWVRQLRTYSAPAPHPVRSRQVAGTTNENSSTPHLRTSRAHACVGARTRASRAHVAFRCGR